MAALVTDYFRVQNAKNLIALVSSNSLYMYLGRVAAWTNDSEPPTPEDDIQQVDYDVWDEMFGLKRVTSSDVKHVIPRVDWTSGTVYEPYDPDTDQLSRQDHYILTDDSGTYKVYKCISNNSGGTSTTQPTSTAAGAFSTADSYVWKYMYSISASDANRFLTPQFMPVSATSGTGNIDNDGPGESPYPQNGHGADNINELGARYVMMNVRFEYDESGSITVENDFRQVGLILDPYTYGTTSVATGTAYRQTTRYTLSGTSGTFSVDELIEGSTPSDTARVVEYDASNNYLYVKLVSGTISGSDSITGADSSATATVSAIANEELEEYSGRCLFINNRTPVTRDTSQIESISFVIEC